MEKSDAKRLDKAEASFGFDVKKKEHMACSFLLLAW